MISADTIERIYATARIDEVVGNYVTKKRAVSRFRQPKGCTSVLGAEKQGM